MYIYYDICYTWYKYIIMGQSNTMLHDKKKMFPKHTNIHIFNNNQ